MKLYEIDVTVYATAYVRADNEHDAAKKAKAAMRERSIEGLGDDLVSGLQYDDPDLPEVSLSPAMTIGEIGDDPAEVG